MSKALGERMAITSVNEAIEIFGIRFLTTENNIKLIGPLLEFLQKHIQQGCDSQSKKASVRILKTLILNTFCISDTVSNQPIETGLPPKSAFIVKIFYGRKGIKNNFLGVQTPESYPIFSQHMQ